MTTHVDRTTRRRLILVAGVGSSGARHVRNLLDLGHRDILLYRTGLGTLANDFDLPVVDCLEAGLERRPLAVIVANPTANHVPTAIRAAQAGAHLLIEKPLSDSLDGVDELRRVVAERRLVALVGYHLRFHLGLRAIRGWILAGRIGNAVSALARWGEYLPDWHPWEDYRTSYAAVPSLGGGVIHTLSHPIDYLAWLLGPVAGVNAMAGTRCELGVECEDVAHVTLRMRSGAIASIILDYARSPRAHTLEIVGSRGLIEWDMNSGVASLCSRKAGAPVERVAGPSIDDRNALFIEEIRHFLACISLVEEPVCTLDDGFAALRVAIAAHDSARDHWTIPIGPDEAADRADRARISIHPALPFRIAPPDGPQLTTDPPLERIANG